MNMRLLHINIPLLLNPTLIDFQGYEAINDDYQFDAQVLADNCIGCDTLLDHAINVLITNNEDSNISTQRYFHGIISKVVKSLSSHSQRYHYAFSFVPSFKLLDKSNHSRIFQGMSAPDIVCTILKENGINQYDTSRLKKHYMQLNYYTQYNESNYSFVKRIMAEHNINYYFQHTAREHILILSDQPPPRSQPPHILYPSALDIDQTNSIPHFYANKAMTCDTYLTSTYNPLAPQQRQVSILNSNNPSNTNKNLLSHYQYYGHGCQAITDQINHRQIQASHIKKNSFTSQSSLLAIHLNTQYTMKEAQAKPTNIIISRIQHHAHDNTAIKSCACLQQFTQSYHNSFDAQLANSPYVAATISPAPTPGVQTARVIGIEPDTINTDQYARIRVQFHWSSNPANNHTNWLRVRQSIAGNKWGNVYIPRVGAEVLVDFINGNPNQPIIIGQAYNAISTTPYTHIDTRLNGIKSSSFTGKTIKTHNSIGFRDYLHNPALEIYAGNDLKVNIKRDFTHHIQHDYKLDTNNGDSEQQAQDKVHICSHTYLKLSCQHSSLLLNSDSISMNSAAIVVNPAS